MRKLATIAEVGEIKPIEGADRIELAVLKGRAWQCVVGKNDFKVGDIGVYMEVDSFLPKKEPFLFLEGRCNKTMRDEEGYRLKTMKMKGCVSQGLFMPIEKFPEIENKNIGDDVTELLGIKLYEAPVPAQLMGEVKGQFPSWISKTDQERIQNCMEYFETLKGVEFEASKKYDGSSSTTYYNNTIPEPFGVCSRNLDLKETENNTFWKVARKLELEKALKMYYEKFNTNLAIQGELVGEGVNGNRMKLTGHDLYIFDLFDIDRYKYVSSTVRQNIVNILKDYVGTDIKHVEIVNPRMKVFDEFTCFDDLHEWVTKQKGINGTSLEGVVFKACEPYKGHIVSFKVINNKYLAKYGE